MLAWVAYRGTKKDKIVQGPIFNESINVDEIAGIDEDLDHVILCDSAKNIIGTSVLRKDITIMIDSYNDLLVEHFHYSDKIIIKSEEEEKLRGKIIPHNVFINRLVISEKSKKWNYHVNIIYPIFEKSVPNIGYDIEIYHTVLSNIPDQLINEFLSRFRKITKLCIGEVTKFIDESVFRNIEIAEVWIDGGNNLENVDVVLSNEHIKTLTLFGGSFTGDMENNYNIVNFELLAATFNGSEEIPPQIARNIWIADNKKYIRTKVASQDE